MAPSKQRDTPSKRVPYAKRANKIHPALNPSVEMPPFVVPAKFIGHFNELKINSLHRIVDLRRIEIIRRHVLNNPHTNIKIPPHVIGGNVNWHLTLHAIKFYSLLPTKDQQAEIAKAASFDIHQRRLLRNNRDRLMAITPSPLSAIIPSCGMSARQMDRQKSRLIALSSERAFATRKVLDSPKSKAGFSKCHKCGFIPTPSILSAAKYQPISSGNCVQCTHAIKQDMKAEAKNNLLDIIYTQQLKSNIPFVEREYCATVSLSNFLISQLDQSYAKSLMKILPKTDVSVKVVHATEFKHSANNFKQITGEVDGASWSMLADCQHPNTTTHDDKFDVTIILFPYRKHKPTNNQHQNFIMLMNANMQQNLVDVFALGEMKNSILLNETAGRPGPASKVFRLGDKSKGLSQITKKATTLFISTSEKAVNMKAIYYNKSGLVKETNYGYKSMLMKRLEKGQKWTEANQNMSFNHILFREAICYITALGCINSLDIGVPIDGLSNLRDTLQSNSDISISQCLVRWMCTTGEMRNHQAVGCHCDGNNSYPLEIYTAFDRPGMIKKDAFLYLPLDNIALQLICGQHLMVCNLTDTPHVADQSRDVNNFSKVHGPCP